MNKKDNTYCFENNRKIQKKNYYTKQMTHQIKQYRKKGNPRLN